MKPEQRDEFLATMQRKFKLGSLSVEEAQAWIGDPLFETHLAEALIANMPKVGEESMILDCSLSFFDGKFKLLDNFRRGGININDYSPRIGDRRINDVPGFSKIDFDSITYERCHPRNSSGWGVVGHAMTLERLVPLGLNHFLALALDYEFKKDSSVLHKLVHRRCITELYFLGQTLAGPDSCYAMRVRRAGRDHDLFFTLVNLNDVIEDTAYYLAIDFEKLGKRSSSQRRGPGLEHTIQ